MNTAPLRDNVRTLVLTGASRGIGHATVKKFSAGGWRVITISRQPFSALCPWPSGGENHVQLDLADPVDIGRGIEQIRSRLAGGRLDALVNNAAISPKGKDGKIDHNTAITGDDLIQFVNSKLFPCLQGFNRLR